MHARQTVKLAYNARKRYNASVMGAEKKDAVYGVDDVADFFGISHKTARTWCKEGKLPAFKIGKQWKVRLSDIHRIINRKVQAKKEKEETLF
jgi:excisionase family DNA binding protein